MKRTNKTGICKMLLSVVFVMTLVASLIPMVGITASAAPATLGNCKLTYTGNWQSINAGSGTIYQCNGCGGLVIYPWGEILLNSEEGRPSLDVDCIDEKTVLVCNDCGATLTLTPIQVTNRFDGYAVTYKQGTYEWNNHGQDWACGGDDCQGLKISSDNIITENGNTHKLAEITEETTYVCSTCNASMKIHKEEKNGTVTIGAKSDTKWIFRNGPITITCDYSDASDGVSCYPNNHAPITISAASTYVITSVTMTIGEAEGNFSLVVDNGTLPESYSKNKGAKIEIKDVNAKTLEITATTTEQFGWHGCYLKDFVVTYEKPHVHNSAEYGCDANQHWTKCSDDEDNNGTPENHTWSNGVCTVCEYACKHDGFNSKKEGNVYTSNCKHNCGITPSVMTLTAPDMKYTGQPYDGASLSFSDWRLSSRPKLMYEGTGDTVYEASEVPPTEIGTYKAMATYGGSAPASLMVEFKITNEDPNTGDSTNVGLIVGLSVGGTVAVAAAAYFVLGFCFYSKGKIGGKFFSIIFKWIKKKD